ncbi:MAG: DNRLRE domain-containing protein, partial [Planctomycetes bacterium]|nr:DNRLRE domain-containing protein [Planctomycetota bacterium]
RIFIERNGSHADPLGGNSTSRNPYLNRIEYDDQGTLHATWTWREKAPIRYNRDLAYAYSDDRGITWLNGAGQLVADTTAAIRIRASSPGITAIALGAEWGLMNSQAQVVDHRGRVHVVMYYKDQPDTVVSYGGGSDSHYRHMWRDADGVWRTFQLPTIGKRPSLFVDRHDNLFLAYQHAGKFKLDRATPEADYLDWATVYTYAGNFRSTAVGAICPTPKGIFLSAALQEAPATAGAPSALGVVDTYLPDPPAAARDAVRPRATRILTERDTFVRGGIHAAATHGTDSILTAQHAPTVDDERLAFVRFDLADLQDKGAVTRAVLRLFVASSGTGWVNETIEVRVCSTDTWSETTTDWNNRPLPIGATFSAAGGGAFVDVDLTSAIVQELAAGGSRISFQIAATNVNAGPVVAFHAREAGAAFAPRLRVHQENRLAPVADAYVRSGAHATLNFGAQTRVHVKDDPNQDFDREAYLKFDLHPLEGTGSIGRAFLVLQCPVSGPLGPTTPFRAHLVTDDSWLETQLTWTTRPGYGPPIAAHFARDTMTWDVTNEVLGQLAGDGVLSLALSSGREGSDRILHLWAKEAPNASARPRLVLRYASAP